MKLILTETQYNALKMRLNEFDQNEVNKIFVKGNIVTFYVKSGDEVHPIKLEVMGNPPSTKDGKPLANVFILKNLSDFPLDVKGSFFLLTQPNQDIRTGDFFVKNLGRKNENGYYFNKPKNYSFKNIFKVEVKTADGKLIDTFFAKEHDKQEEPDSIPNKLVGGFQETLDSLKVGDVLQLIVKDNKILPLRFVDRKSGVEQFEIVKSQNQEIPLEFSHRNYSLIEISRDHAQVKPETNELVASAKFYWQENGEMKNELGRIHIKDWEISEDIGDDEEEEETGNSTENAREMMQAILSDPLMKKAFYSEPTLWNYIVSAVKGENPRGTGIGPAMDIISRYTFNKVKKRIGMSAENFKAGKAASFKFIEKGVDMNPTGQLQDKLSLPITSTFRATVQQYKLKDDNLVLASSQPKFKLIINEELKGVENGFLVTVVKEIRTSAGIQEFKKTAKVIFISQKGTGYFREPKQETRPNTK